MFSHFSASSRTPYQFSFPCPILLWFHSDSDSRPTFTEIMSDKSSPAGATAFAKRNRHMKTPIIFIDASRKNVNQQWTAEFQTAKHTYLYTHTHTHTTLNHFVKTVGACHHHLQGGSGACHHHLAGLCPVLTAPHMHDYCGSWGKPYHPLPHSFPAPPSQ